MAGKELGYVGSLPGQLAAVPGPGRLARLEILPSNRYRLVTRGRLLDHDFARNAGGLAALGFLRRRWYRWGCCCHRIRWRPWQRRTTWQCRETSPRGCSTCPQEDRFARPRSEERRRPPASPEAVRLRGPRPSSETSARASIAHRGSRRAGRTRGTALQPRSRLLLR